MSVKVGSARSSYGNTARGDQSGGKEVSTQDWYLHKLGWVVLRPRSVRVADAIATAMQAACDNNNIGYDQDTRSGLYNAVKGRGYDPALCTDKVNTDCSALVRVCCLYAGVQVGGFNTSDEAETLLRTGAFDKLTDDKYTKQSAYLRRGDILVTRTKGHTVVVLSNGSKAQTDVKRVEITGEKVNVRTGAGTLFGILKTVHKGDVFEYTDTSIVDDTVWYRIPAGWVSGKMSREV